MLYSLIWSVFNQADQNFSSIEKLIQQYSKELRVPKNKAVFYGNWIELSDRKGYLNNVLKMRIKMNKAKQ